MNYNHLKYVLLCIAMTVFTCTTIAQNDEDLSQAKELKALYEKEDIIILEQEIDIDFERDSKNNKVVVLETKKTTYLSISPYAKMVYSTGYDNESEIKTLAMMSPRGRGRTVSWETNDEAYATESIFHNDYRIKYGDLVFSLQGTRKTIKEEKRYKDIKYFTSHYFTEGYRILDGTVNFNIPNWLDLELKEYNFTGYEIAQNESKEKEINTITFTSSNVKPGKNEYRMQGSSFIYPHLLLLAKSYTTKNGDSITLFKETKDLYNWYSSLTSAVDVDASVTSDQVKTLIKDLSTDEEKIKAIYYWVQDNIKYIAFEDGIAGFKPDAPQNVFTKRYGDCKGMAILLKTMLIDAGYDARLVWIGTDNIAYDYSTPSLSVDNHMITAVMIDDKPIFIDGTEKFNRFKTFASRIQGKQALVENGNDFILAHIPESDASANLESYQVDLNIENEDLVGHIKKIYKGEQVSSFLYRFTDLPKDKRIEVLERVLTDGNENAKVENMTDFDPKNRDIDLELEYDIKISNAVSSFDGTYYLEVDPVRFLSDFQLDEERENAYQFSFKRKEVKEINLEIPEGLSITTLPETLIIDNECMSVKKEYQVVNGTIKYSSSIIIKNRLIPPAFFETWNTSINDLKNFYDEQIVLTKS